MNREEVLERAKEFKKLSKEYEEVSFIESDTEFFDYIIKELERTDQEVPVQEQSISSNLKANITIKGLDVLKKSSFREIKEEF